MRKECEKMKMTDKENSTRCAVCGAVTRISRDKNGMLIKNIAKETGFSYNTCKKVVHRGY